MRKRDQQRIIRLMIQMIRAEGQNLADIKAKIRKIYMQYGLV